MPPERSDPAITIDWDVPIAMDDGVVLRADVFRPTSDGAVPDHPGVRAIREGADVPGRATPTRGEP